MRTLILSLMLLAALSSPSEASVIALFDNPTYVDTSGGPPVPSSDALQALLASQGNTVHTFTGLTATDFTTALGGADLILFPHLLNFGVLASDLSSSAKAVLANYVSSGGGLIAVGDSAAHLLNTIFYPTCDFVTVFCFATSGGSGPSFLDASVAAGTPFAGAPAVLTDPPAAGNGLNPFAFTPAGGHNLYRDHVSGSPNSTTVLTAPFGSGQFGFLAWNFVDASPFGGLDGGWNGVLGLTVSAVAAAPAAVPEPRSSSLLALALAVLGGTMRLRSRRATRVRS